MADQELFSLGKSRISAGGSGCNGSSSFHKNIPFLVKILNLRIFALIPENVIAVIYKRLGKGLRIVVGATHAAFCEGILAAVNYRHVKSG